MQIATKEKFNELIRGGAGDTALITFDSLLHVKNNEFTLIAGFDGKTVDPPKKTAATVAANAPAAPTSASTPVKKPDPPSVPVSAVPDTGSSPVFRPRTGARTGRRIVAVPELTATKNVSEDLVISFTAAVTSGLAENKNINRVVDYNQINRIMEQHRFEASDWSNSAKYAEIGKALNVDTIAVGTISLGGKPLFTQMYVLSVHLVDISTMAVAGSFTYTAAATAMPSWALFESKTMRVSQ
jgi:hypothetical protein